MELSEKISARSLNDGKEFVESITADKNQSDEESDRKWIRCRNCHYKVALLSAKININNAENHIFENPAGIIYRVVCFSNAPGTINISDYTGENSWFHGYLWSISLCRSCNNHLGWHYDSGSGDFFGLIADRLTGI